MGNIVTGTLHLHISLTDGDIGGADILFIHLFHSTLNVLAELLHLSPSQQRLNQSAGIITLRSILV
jgi:hypothetical protein